MTRKEVATILHDFGVENEFALRTTRFSDLARDDVQVVTIREWEPSLKAYQIKDALWSAGRCLVEFNDFTVQKSKEKTMAMEVIE